MTHAIKAPKKLIEVALPLNAINAAAAKEKSIRHGHPSTLHLYWARRPLAAARAVIFSQMVNDPSWKWELEHAGEVPPNNLKATWAKSRQRLFRIIEELVTWESTTDEAVLDRARLEIRKSWRETCEINRDHPRAADLFNENRLPAFYDPFAGGGSLPLEAQRLGLESYASDLNPVAVVINKAMIEIPPRFVGQGPVNPPKREEKSLIARTWHGGEALADDVRYYGEWMRAEADRRLGHLYPKVEVTHELAKGRTDLKPYVGKQLQVIAWLWARTVRSPNPAYSAVDVPLASTFMLCTKEGREAFVQPIIANGNYRFEVKVGTPRDYDEIEAGTSAGKRKAFVCLMSKTPIGYEHIRTEALAGRLGARLMAMVVDTGDSRVYLSPTSAMEEAARRAEPTWRPDCELPRKHRNFQPPGYGMTNLGDLFTPRQLVTLTTLSDLVTEAGRRAEADALAAGMPSDGRRLRDGGNGAAAYGDAVSVYLSFCVDKATITNTTQATWQKDPDRLTQAFGRQAIPMVWDYAEANPLSDAGGGFGLTPNAVAKVLERLPRSPSAGACEQQDAATTMQAELRVVSTDPPYYDNIEYAYLSDYFYAWMRRSLRDVFPALFATVAVPKAEELVASTHRHGTKENAEIFFLSGMTQVMHRLAEQASPMFPVTIYYAFKQSESDANSDTSSTGWETFLDAVIKAGFAIDGTWPMRTELTANLKKTVGALASSVVLVCRPRAVDAESVSRRQFVNELRVRLPEALDAMTRGADEWGSPVAPVDLSQAIIGPGMQVFTKYASVLEADGSPMSVRTALTLINRFLADDDFDSDTQFCLAWFEQHGWKSGSFGSADTLARAKGTSVEGVKSAGVVHSAGGSVRLTRPSEYPNDWDIGTDDRTPVWEVLHHLIRALRADGEEGAAAVLGSAQSRAQAARQLAYRLYTMCERSGWAEDARAYNELIASWSAIESTTAHGASVVQPTLFES